MIMWKNGGDHVPTLLKGIMGARLNQAKWFVDLLIKTGRKLFRAYIGQLFIEYLCLGQCHIPENWLKSVLVLECLLDRVKRIWYLSPMRAAKVQAVRRHKFAWRGSIDKFVHGWFSLPHCLICEHICTLYLLSVNFIQMLTRSVLSFKWHNWFCLTQ